MADERNLHIFKKLHWASIMIGALSIILPIVFWDRIPEQIPMHYNAEGVVDNWSDKSSLILLFMIIAFMMGVMSIVVYCVKSNMNSKYTAEHEKSEMSVVYPMIILMNLVLQFMFAYIMFCVVTCRKLGVMFLPITTICTFAPLVYMLYKCGKIKATSPTQKAVFKKNEQQEQGVTYRTAVDWWLGLLLGGTELYMVYLAVWPIISKGQAEWGMLITAVGVSVILVPLFKIKYVMYEEHLLVSMGFYGKERVKYEDIVDVKETMNPISSAAMSLRRIQIDYVENGVHRMVLISPVRKKNFLKELDEKRHKNGAIE